MECPTCGWTFRGGGYETKKQRDEIERSQKKVHEQSHKKLSKSNSGQSLNTILKVERDSHAAELGHSFVEQPTEQPTTSTTYSDVSGVSLVSGTFTAGQTYLIFVTASKDESTNTVAGAIQMVHGTTAFADSEFGAESTTLAQRLNYAWWTVWTAVSGEAIKMQTKTFSATNTTSVNLCTISAIKLTPDLTLNSDFRHNLKSVSTPLVENTDSSTTDNATITFTPPAINHRWLILSKARYGPGIPPTTPATSVYSKIHRSGAATSSLPEMQMEGEDGVNDMYVMVGVRTDTLTSAVSNTYEEVSKVMQTGAASVNRTHSGIFALDLENFRTAQTIHEEGVEEDITVASATTPYGYNILSKTISPAVTGDVFILAGLTYDVGSGGATAKFRLRVNNVNQPGNQTATAYDYDQIDTTDRIPFYLNTIENLATGSTHTIDIDGSVGVVAAGAGTYLRHITAFSMEMAGSALVAIRNDTVGISSPAPLKFSGTGVAKVPTTQSIGIGESSIKLLSSSANTLLAENLQLRLSGGSNNTDPILSLGGVKSSVTDVSGGGFTSSGFTSTGFTVPAALTLVADYEANDYVAADYETTIRTVGGEGSGIIFTTLLDNVLLSEAIAGDPADYRCFYLHNSHTSLTMVDLVIWIDSNTPAADEVQIGLGGAAVNGVEQTIANEDTAPTSPTITFTTADSRANALAVGTIPPGQHKAVWIKRIVPANTPPYLNNTYSFRAEWYPG